MTENKNNDTALKFAKATLGVRAQELQRPTLDLSSVFSSRGVNLDNGLDNI